MIKLDVEPYCVDCADFVPDVETFTVTRAVNERSCLFADHTIRCVNRQKCCLLEKHIRQEMSYEKFRKED